MGFLNEQYNYGCRCSCTNKILESVTSDTNIAPFCTDNTKSSLLFLGARRNQDPTKFSLTFSSPIYHISLISCRHRSYRLERIVVPNLN